MILFLNKYLGGEFGKKSFIAVLIKGCGVFFNLLFSIVLARFFVEDVLGKYSKILALVNLIKIPILLGFPTLLLREFSRNINNSDNLKLVYTAFCSILLTIVLFSIFFFGFVRSFSSELESYLFLLILVLYVFLSFFGSILQGFNKVILNQLLEFLVLPILILLFTFSCLQFVTAKEIVQVLIILAASLTVTISIMYLASINLLGGIRHLYNSRAIDWKYLQLSFPFLLIGGINMLNIQIDILMLSIFVEDFELGIYKVSMNGANIIFLIMTSLHSVIIPTLSRMFSENEMGTIQNIINGNFRKTLVLTTPFMIVFILFGDIILSFFWGTLYIDGYNALLILASGMYIHALLGPAGNILSISGNEKVTLIGTLIILILNIVLNLIFIPLFGLEGAAITTVVGNLVGKIYWVFMLKKKTNILSFYAKFNGKH